MCFWSMTINLSLYFPTNVFPYGVYIVVCKFKLINSLMSHFSVYIVNACNFKLIYYLMYRNRIRNTDFFQSDFILRIKK